MKLLNHKKLERNMEIINKHSIIVMQFDIEFCGKSMTLPI